MTKFIAFAHNGCRVTDMNFQENFSNWSRNTDEKAKIPAFYETRNFIISNIKARHLSLSWSNPVHAPFHLKLYFNIISRLCLGLPSGLFYSGLPTKTLRVPLHSPIRATCTAHLIFLDFITRTIFGEQYRSLSSSLCSFIHSLVTLSLLGPNIVLSSLFANTTSLVPPSRRLTKFRTHSKQQAKL